MHACVWRKQTSLFEKLLQDRLGMSDKEWEKCRVAFVMLGKATYVDEEDKVIPPKLIQVDKSLCNLQVTFRPFSLVTNNNSIPLGPAYQNSLTQVKLIKLKMPNIAFFII